ncbi:MAG: hypothetical protein HY906_00325 [Deltaproteobacteria bacterium]|nr:hypothetical protein [Deltaproteobacteria bacterium]
MTPRTRVVLAVVLAAGLAPAGVRAQPAVFLESESLLAARRWAPGFAHERDIEQCRASADLSDYCRRLLVPFYEYLTLHAENFGVRGLSVEFAGWGVVDLADRFDPTKAARVPQKENGNSPGVGGDVLVGTASYRSRDGKLELRLGRQFLFLGAPYSTNFDGLFARYTFPYDFSLAVYGGGATPRDAEAGRDALNPMFGGRLAWSRLDRGGLGLAYLEEMTTSGELVRRQAGVDAFAVLPKHIELYGSALFDVAEIEGVPKVEEATLVASWMPTPRLKLALDYTYIVPAALISKNSIFSVFSDSNYHDAGLDAYFRVTPRLKLSAQLKARAFSDGEQGWLGGVGGRYLLGESWRQVVGVDLQRLFSKNDNLERSGYYQARLYGSVEPVTRLYLTADLYYFHFDGAVWGPNAQTTGASAVRDAGSLSVIAGYRISPTMDTLLSLTANFNPASRYETIFLGRFVWHTWLESKPQKVQP